MKRFTKNNYKKDPIEVDSMGNEVQEYYFIFDHNDPKEIQPIVKMNECNSKNEPSIIEKHECDSMDEPPIDDKYEWDLEVETPITKEEGCDSYYMSLEEQECCSLVEPWLVAQMEPISKELECGPIKEQWIVANMGCILQKRGAWKILEQSYIEEVKIEPKKEKFKNEISRCDAKLHPNICVRK